MFSASLSAPDIARRSRHFAFVPEADLGSTLELSFTATDHIGEDRQLPVRLHGLSETDRMFEHKL
jgi:hypothetical protein